MKLPKFNSQATRDALRDALRVGFTIERGKHWKVMCPRGRLVVVIGHSISNWRAERNIVSDIARVRRELHL